MVRGVSFSVVVAAWMLSGQHVEAGNISDGSQLYRAAIHVAVNGLEELVAHATSSIGRFMVDGGGDGGGDGGSDGSDGDTGDSDSTSGDTSAPDDSSDPVDSVSSQANAAASDPTDPSDPTITNPAVANDPSMTPEMAAIEAIPTTAPRGGFDPLNPNPAYPTIGDASAPGTDTKGGTLAGIPVAAPGVNAPVDVGINAVIVSGAQSPWDAIGRVPGVGTVTVTGGIIALGKTPILGEPPGGGPQPPWLRLVPDLKLLDGSVIPPVIPNVIDIRITRYSIAVHENPNN